MAQWSSPEPSVLLKHVAQKTFGFFRNVLESSSIILRPDDVQLSPARDSSGRDIKLISCTSPLRIRPEGEFARQARVQANACRPYIDSF